MVTPASGSPDSVARELRGFGPLGLLALLLVLSGNLLFQPLSAILVLAWASRSATPWKAIGLAPRAGSWGLTIAAGLLAGGLLKFATKAVLLPLLGAPPINAAYHDLEGNAAALPGMIFAIVVSAGIGEEIVFRGYLFERLHALLGTSRAMNALILLVTSGLFGLAHWPEQRLPGIEHATAAGLGYGLLYLATGTLWLPMAAHIGYDLTALWMIYGGRETAVAHLFFR